MYDTFIGSGTCKSINQLFQWNTAVFSAVEKDRDETQRHILHKDQEEEKGLGGRRCLKPYRSFFFFKHLFKEILTHSCLN